MQRVLLPIFTSSVQLKSCTETSNRATYSWTTTTTPIYLTSGCRSSWGLRSLMSQQQGVAGTIGYVAPEYAMTCRVSEKADVYSYGIVILELISDKRAAGSFFLFSREWIQHCLVKSKLRMFSQRDYGRLVLRTIQSRFCIQHSSALDSLSIRLTMKNGVKQLKRIQPSRL